MHFIIPFFRSTARHIAGCCFLFLALAGAPLMAQSTYGTILGTVHDRSGALLPGAKVTLLNEGTNAVRVQISDAQGDYAFKNIDPGKYMVMTLADGFKKEAVPGLLLTARQTLRVDATLDPGAESTTIEVVGDVQSTISTEVSNLAVTQQGDELVELPVAVYSRSTGSTSPIDTLTTQSGVQSDATGNLMVMGATPELLSVTVDGISSVGVEYSGPVNEMFPSFNSIEEIRVSESNNNAEFSGVADITTVSKAGTASFHGGIFENHENSALEAGQPIAFASSKPRLVMNDFGATLGGPLNIPHSNLGNNTFFFISYEGLRLPRESPNVVNVPSLAMRSGNLKNYLYNTYCLNSDGTLNTTVCPNGYYVVNDQAGSQITDASGNTQISVNAIQASILNALLPAPNFGGADSVANNYQINYKTPISTNQGDVRLDRTISAKQNLFGRFSYKNRQVVLAPSLGCGTSFCQEGGGPMQGTYNYPEIDEGMTFAHNYIFSDKLLNEFRGGFNAQHLSATQSFRTSQLLQQLGMTAMQPDTDWAEAPLVMINGFIGTGGGNPMVQRGQIIELLDNVSWTKGRHSFKFGADFKRLTDHDDNVDGNYRSGWYVFNGSSELGGRVGDPYAQFLLGFPDYTAFSTSNNVKMDGVGYGYAFYGQDDWKLTKRLTLNLGMRYELHPPLRDSGYNTGYFLPDYTSTTSEGVVHGALVVPNDQAKSFENAQLEQSIGPTPTLTASEAGLPAGLRFTGKTDFGPRLGFAWRVLGNDKLVVRGGWGRFIETPTGFSLTSGYGVASTYIGYFYQDWADAAKTQPLYSFSNPYSNNLSSAVGSNLFYWAFPIHYTDPSVQQWNLTVEKDLGKGIGMRASYTGSHGSDLEVMEDLNQVRPNSYGYNGVDPTSTPVSNTACGNTGSQVVSDQRPYPCWAVVQSVANAGFSNYSSATLELSRRSGRNLTFDLSYSFTRDLSNAGGLAPSSLTGVTGGASGGGWLTNRFNPGLDYGNVAYDRRQRFLGTYLYQLPFGHKQRWLSHTSLLQSIAGDWQVGGVVVAQTGPFLTPYQQTSDPAGTNILSTVGLARPDRVKGVSLYAQNRTTSNWLNPDAFSIPQANGGTFGTAAVGSVVGPGTENVSMSLARDISFTEKTKFELMIEAANLFNHRNYEAPNMQLDGGSYGSITAWQTAEGAGPRCLELSGRITF
jgi:hypothetical protein